jgi:small subunit ribosomal protein S7
MPRKQRSASRYVKRRPDTVYGSIKVRQLTNMLMKDGKYTKAYKILCGSFNLVLKDDGSDKLPEEQRKHKVNELFEKILDEAAPSVEVKSRRIGGANYQVPTEVRPARRLTLAMRWILKFARQRGKGSMERRLADEFIDILHGRGNTLREKDNMHRMAKANQAFANIKR